MSDSSERGGNAPSEVDGPPRDHILADENIGALLWRLSIPATVGMAVMATYNLVDAIFIGRGVGALGLAGLAIVFPLQLIVMSVGQLIGMGGSSIISRALGSGDIARAHRTFGNVLTLILVAAGAITAAGFGYIDALLKVFGATDAILPYARSYLAIILWGTAFRCYGMAHNNIIRSEGRARVAMVTMMVGAIVNIILDPILIFGLKMGMQGAALATVIAQGCSSTFIISYFASGKSSIGMRLRDMRPDFGIVREILAVGSASFGRMAAGSIVMVVLNHSLGQYGGNIAIATFGLINRLTQFLFMPIIGFAQALQPVAGFNYGAKRFEMAKRTMRISGVRATIFSIVSFTIIMTLPHYLARLFTNDPELLGMAVPAMRIVAAAFPVIGLQMLGAAMFQAFGRAAHALFLTLSRQVLFLIPLVFLLSRLVGLWGIFWSFPAADSLSATVTLILLAREFRRLDRKEAQMVELREA